MYEDHKTIVQDCHLYTDTFLFMKKETKLSAESWILTNYTYILILWPKQGNTFADKIKGKKLRYLLILLSPGRI